MAKSDGVRQYKAKLIDTFPENTPLTVNVLSPLSQQNIAVAIGSENLIGKCNTHILENTWNFLSYIGLVISAIIVLAVTVWSKFFLC